MAIQALLATSAVGAVGGGGASVTLSTVPALVVAGSSGTFASCTATTTGGVASAWVWSVIAQSGGTFSIASGAGTATAAAQVTGATGSIATALLQCVVTVGGTPRTVTTALSFTNSTVVSVSQSVVPAQSGTVGNTTFAASVITAYGGTPSSYTWSVINQVNGTFGLGLGVGTYNVNANVAGVGFVTTATADLQCVTVIGGTPYTTSTPLSYTNTAGSPSFSVSISPTVFSITGTTATLTTASGATATVSGGTPAYGYAWVCIANDAGAANSNFTAVSPTSATTLFRAVGMISGDGPIVATFELTATDSASHSATGTTTVTFERT